MTIAVRLLRTYLVYVEQLSCGVCPSACQMPCHDQQSAHCSDFLIGLIQELPLDIRQISEFYRTVQWLKWSCEAGGGLT